MTSPDGSVQASHSQMFQQNQQKNLIDIVKQVQWEPSRWWGSWIQGMKGDMGRNWIIQSEEENTRGSYPI